MSYEQFFMFQLWWSGNDEGDKVEREMFHAAVKLNKLADLPPMRLHHHHAASRAVVDKADTER